MKKIYLLLTLIGARGSFCADKGIDSSLILKDMQPKWAIVIGASIGMGKEVSKKQCLCSKSSTNLKCQ